MGALRSYDEVEGAAGSERQADDLEGLVIHAENRA